MYGLDTKAPAKKATSIMRAMVIFDAVLVPAILVDLGLLPPLLLLLVVILASMAITSCACNVLYCDGGDGWLMNDPHLV